MSANIADPDDVTAEHTRDGYFFDGCDHIDPSNLDDDDYDDDNWLYMPLQCPSESVIQDLYAWLKTEPELDVRNNKKCIDTRTFTRPKKRSARTSFESIFERLPPSITDTEKMQETNLPHIDVQKYLYSVIGNEESVPAVLKPSIKTTINILSGENSAMSGQESMEAFINMSQSKGIDSFINLGEPEFSDLFTNMSQPSLLNMSIIASTNDPTFIKSNTIEMNKSTTQSDMEASSNSDVCKTFVMQGSDDTIISDETYHTNIPSHIYKEFLQSDKGLNETYNADTFSRISRSSLDKGEVVSSLSSTFVAEPNIDTTFVQSQDEASNSVKSLNTTYLFLAKDAERPILPVTINDTYTPTTRADKINLNVACKVPDETAHEMHVKENALDISFEVPECNQSTPMNSNVQNAGLKFAPKSLNQPQSALYSTSLRRELLAEIQRSDERKLNSTYNYNDHSESKNTKENVCKIKNENETDVSLVNKYPTYSKTALTAMANQYVSRNEMATVAAQKELPMDQRKFYTFTKKTNPIERIDNTASENIENYPNMNSTFRKPAPSKVQQKQSIPRSLSKLPQFLQKSNPNLVSGSLKNMDGISRTNVASIGNIKGSQPNIVYNIEKSQLSSKLLSYKTKSDSEQRLLEADVNPNNHFPIKTVIAGSTESIESTHSVHSAPDLDDRFSTCSDSSSHNSCTKQTINIEHEKMQAKSLKQDSVLKPNRVLENTWVEETTNMPSLILKNGVEHSEIEGHLLNDLNMKCSSPIISPTGSSHALNNDGNAESNTLKTTDEIIMTEEIEGLNQVVPKIENKTRLRQPTNWNTGTKPAAVISGIPRPASRIPAPRFVRPNTKTAQADLKKGCINRKR